MAPRWGRAGSLFFMQHQGYTENHCRWPYKPRWIKWMRRCPLGETIASSCASTKSDRKSTRLNSSHQIISYAVFCLKKKKKNIQGTPNQHISSTPTPTYHHPPAL